MGLSVLTLIAYSSGPPDGVTGAPGEGLCSQLGCHSSGTQDGTPSFYYTIPVNAGDTLLFTVQLADPDAQRWGFELTLLDPSGVTVGTFELLDATLTQTSTQNNRVYVKHTSQGTFAGQTDSAFWEFRWIAPSNPVDVTVYIAYNGANGNGLSSGDAIYTLAVPIQVTAVQESPRTRKLRFVTVPGGIRLEGEPAVVSVFEASSGRLHLRRALLPSEILRLPRGVYILKPEGREAARTVRVVIP